MCRFRSNRVLIIPQDIVLAFLASATSGEIAHVGKIGIINIVRSIVVKMKEVEVWMRESAKSRWAVLRQIFP
jgi:hypothetical protein